jgi:class 3 adenylate cyclase
LSTGKVAAALLGSDEGVEYSVVGDTVNVAQRLQQWADAGEVVMSERTLGAIGLPVAAERLEPLQVKGRASPVVAYRISRSAPEVE